MPGHRVLIIAHRVPVDGSFTLNDLAGGGGRMDEVARCVSTSFTVSNGLRRGLEMTILFVAEPPPRARKIRISSDRVRYLNPDERSTAALLKNALTRSTALERDFESSPGIVVGPVDPLEELERFARQPDALWLQEDGGPLRSFRTEMRGFSAILSDDKDLTAAERDRLTVTAVPRVSVAPVTLRASQCLDVLLNEFDLREGHEAPVA
ncbi:MAG: tRNA (pseudouridine(54)-N(1))-methyltransferase TrmY [Thermoplasmata archaeon]